MTLELRFSLAVLEKETQFSFKSLHELYSVVTPPAASVVTAFSNLT